MYVYVPAHSTINGKTHEGKDYACLGPRDTTSTQYPCHPNKLSFAVHLWRVPRVGMGHSTLYITSSNVWASVGVS